MTKQEFRYIVKQPFKYNGKQYQRGDTWEPENAPKDAVIARTLVRVEPVIEPVQEVQHVKKTRPSGH